MSGDAAQDVTDVKSEDENDSNPTITSQDTDDDINEKMLSQPLEPGTKAARYTASKQVTHNYEARKCPLLYAACFIAWHGPSFRYFFTKAADTDENPSDVFFSMPRDARITVKFWEERVRDVARDTMRETVRENNWNWAAVLALAVLKRGYAPSEYDLGGFVNWTEFAERNDLGSVFYGAISSDEESSGEESSSPGDE
ncbi:hypothetical protein FCOIX_12896 [Fusarium coicis]|nr:hypothetical protein FCOIX_12896 [Fusarium coicis]